MEHIALSILVPTVPMRVGAQFKTLITDLYRQAEGLPVEILGLYDNKKRSIGAKRNALLELAQGDYIVFIDDDDIVANDYVKIVLEVINANPDADCITYNIISIEDNQLEIHCTYDVNFDYESDRNAGWWKGKPTHTHLWRASLVKSQKFPDQNVGEDYSWIAKVCPLVKKQVNIDKVLYWYRFFVHDH
jgi:glycosyltransferase involved in cell wall biosynthesis